MSELTSEKLMKIMSEYRDKYPPQPSPFAGLFRPLVPEFAGIKVYEKPPPPPKIQLSKECAELVGAEFANRMNAWLADRFGRQEDSIYFMSGFGILASRKNIAMITNLTA